jgi:hypothetical protein
MRDDAGVADYARPFRQLGQYKFTVFLGGIRDHVGADCGEAIARLAAGHPL